MRTALILILTIALTGFSSPQENFVYTKFISPLYIPQNSEFQITALVKNTFGEADSLELVLEIDKAVPLDSIVLRGNDTTLALSWREIPPTGFSSKAFSVDIDFADTLLSAEDFLQLVYFLNSDGCSKIRYTFDYRYKLKGDTTALAEKFFERGASSEIKSYNTATLAGNALAVEGKGGIEIRLPKAGVQSNLIYDFWVKFSDSCNASFSFRSGEENDSLCAMRINRRGLLNVCESENVTMFDDYAFSLNSWYKFTFFVERGKGEILCFVNKTFLARREYVPPALLNAPVMLISSEGGKVFLDNLKILLTDFGYENYLDEKSALKKLPDSLTVLYAENFDSYEPRDNGLLSFSEGEILTSDAPLLLAYPELNISVFTSYYLLKWKPAGELAPKEFVLERSENGKDFLEIFRQEADKEKEEYTFTDEKITGKQIVIYRILEKTEEGLDIYSNQVKVGQGAIEEFALEQNYPNPFGKAISEENPATTITLRVFVPDEYRVTVYDVVGKEVKILHAGPLSSGVYRFLFDGGDLPSGIYFYEVSTPTSSKVMKMILAK